MTTNTIESNLLESLLGNQLLSQLLAEESASKQTRQDTPPLNFNTNINIVFEDSLDSDPTISTMNSPGSSLVPLEPPTSGFSMDYFLVLQTLQAKQDQLGIEYNMEDIEDLSKTIQEYHEQVIEALEKFIEQMKEAAKSGLIGKIFGWIGVAAGIIGGIAMVATGAGTVAGVAMIALSVDMAVGLATGTSALGELTGAIADGLVALGMDEMAASIVAAVIVTAIVIVATVGAGYAGAASSTAASTSGATSASTSAATTAASTSARTAATTAASTSARTTATTSQAMANGLAANNRISQLAQLSNWQSLHQVRNVSIFASSGSQVGAASAGIDASVHKKEADDAKVEEVRIRSVIEQNKARIDNAIEHVRNLTEYQASKVTQMIDMISQHYSTNQTLIKNIV